MSNTQDPFEMFRRLWGPLGLPIPGMAVPTLDPDEVEKRIADLRSIEAWLSMNLNMVKMSISGLEVQRAALLAMRAGAVPGPSKPAAGDADNPGLLWPWTLMQNPLMGTQPPSDGSGKFGGKKDG